MTILPSALNEILYVKFLFHVSIRECITFRHDIYWSFNTRFRQLEQNHRHTRANFILSYKVHWTLDGKIYVFWYLTLILRRPDDPLKSQRGSTAVKYKLTLLSYFKCFFKTYETTLTIGKLYFYWNPDSFFY